MPAYLCGQNHIKGDRWECAAVFIHAVWMQFLLLCWRHPRPAAHCWLQIFQKGWTHQQANPHPQYLQIWRTPSLLNFTGAGSDHKDSASASALRYSCWMLRLLSRLLIFLDIDITHVKVSFEMFEMFMNFSANHVCQITSQHHTHDLNSTSQDVDGMSAVWTSKHGFFFINAWGFVPRAQLRTDANVSHTITPPNQRPHRTKVGASISRLLKLWTIQSEKEFIISICNRDKAYKTKHQSAHIWSSSRTCLSIRGCVCLSGIWWWWGCETLAV